MQHNGTPPIKPMPPLRFVGGSPPDGEIAKGDLSGGGHRGACCRAGGRLRIRFLVADGEATPLRRHPDPAILAAAA